MNCRLDASTNTLALLRLHTIQVFYVLHDRAPLRQNCLINVLLTLCAYEPDAFPMKTIPA